MVDLLVILCPPRSFSSVISTMIGQHPEMYGLPELHLGMGDTVGDVIERDRRVGRQWGRLRELGPPGLLRTLSELECGSQGEADIARVGGWLEARRDWSTGRMLDHVLGLVSARTHARVAVEKSPMIAANPRNLARQRAIAPHATYLHLTRNPIEARSSALRLRAVAEEERPGLSRDSRDPLYIWTEAHRNILKLLAALPAGQAMRLRGEDILSDPETWLAQIAEWQGLGTCPRAIEAMKHPERSAYAGAGPANADGGHDPFFLESPALRASPSADDLATVTFAQVGGHIDRETARATMGLVEMFGYG